MAEEVKKKRGRPPKQKTTEAKNTNENAQQIKMSVEQKEKKEQPITINQVQSLWASTLQKYSGVATTDIMNRAVNNAMLTNPFIQNQRVKTINSTAADMSKSALQQALKNPGNNEQQLRNNSMQLYYTNFWYFCKVLNNVFMNFFISSIPFPIYSY